MAFTNLYKKMVVGVLSKLPKEKLINIIAAAIDTETIDEEAIDEIVNEALNSSEIGSAINKYVDELFDKAKKEDQV